MSYIWRKLQRINKRAVRYRVLFELKELVVEGCSKWQPNKLVVVFTRRSRRRCSQAMIWEPSIRNPYLGSVQWALPEIIDIEVTLFKDSRDEFESKDWTMSIEDVSPMGKARRIATMTINISDYVDAEQFAVPSRHEFYKTKLNICSKKVKNSHITFMMCTQFLKEGKATDDDMQSLASLISIAGPDPTPDLEDEESAPIVKHSNETTDQITKMVEDFNQFLTSFDEEEDPAKKTKLIDEQAADNNKKNPLEISQEANKSNSVPSVESIHEQLNEEFHDASSDMDMDREDSGYKILKLDHHSHSQSLALETVVNNNKDHHHHHHRSIDGDQVDGHMKKQFAKPTSTMEQEDDDLNYVECSFTENCDDSSRQSIKNEKDEDEEEEEEAAAESDNNVNINNNNNNDDDDDIGHKSGESRHHYSAAEDLLNWCQEITKDYSEVRITNMTTSWRNGIAFGAIIHHFRPDLIDFQTLQPNDIVGNCKKVFDAAQTLGIPKLIDPHEMIVLNVPDKLSVMTYLYQIRSYFTGRTARPNQNDSASTSESNITDHDEIDEIKINNHKADLQPEVGQNSLKAILGETLPIAENLVELENPKLMTKKQLLYPFDSDSEEEIELMSKAKNNDMPRFEDLIEYEHFKSSPKSEIFKPIRKPLQYKRKKNGMTNVIPTYYSKLSFDDNYRSVATGDDQSPESPSLPLASPKKDNTANGQIAPGLYNLSPNSSNQMSRTFSAPNCQDRSGMFKLHSVQHHQCLSFDRGEELRIRARKLLESVRNDSNNKPYTDNNKILSQKEEERLKNLRERARRLIANARQGIAQMDSFDSTLSSSTSTHSIVEKHPSPVRSPNSYDQNILRMAEEKVRKEDPITVSTELKAINHDDLEKSATGFPGGDGLIPKNLGFNFYEFKNNENHVKPKKMKSPLMADGCVVERKKSPKNQKADSSHDYNDFPATLDSLQEELNDVEKQQQKIDSEASILEKRLRKVMETGGNKKLEEKLIQNWFVLVNKRNAIIRRQMQLNILEKEADMNRRYDELNSELRGLMLIEELEKTNEQRSREKELLDQLVTIVNARNDLVLHLDNQEKAIEEDEYVENQIHYQPVVSSDGANVNDKNCIIQ